MKHFSEQVWTDFVRGVGPSKTNGAIEAQIAGGCAECAATGGVWKKVYSIAANELSFTPPDHAVRMVKLEFTTRQSPRLSPWTMASLMFDSLSQPLTAGVRSGASESRQLVFEAEGTMVDLVLDTRPQSGTISLVGQVVDKGGDKIAPRQVAVIVWTETALPYALPRSLAKGGSLSKAPMNSANFSWNSRRKTGCDYPSKLQVTSQFAFPR